MNAAPNAAPNTAARAMIHANPSSIAAPETPAMNPLMQPGQPSARRLLKASAAVAALGSALLLGACATNAPPPAALVEARASVRGAELDPAVMANAPLELKRASDSLNRANALQDKGESLAEINSAAYVANQQAKTALAIGRAKGSDNAIAGAVVERERTRADLRTTEADRARAQAATAQGQASSAQAQARMAQDQATAARTQTDQARQQTAQAEQRASGAELVAAAALVQTSDAQQQAADLKQQLADLQARPTERGLLVTLGDVLFEFNRADIKPAAMSSLTKLALFLQKSPARRVLIEGHTDNIGSAAYNETLSRRRADAVKTELMRLGVAEQRFSTQGYGPSFPITDNSSDTNRALNRRVEVYISETDDQAVRPRR